MEAVDQPNHQQCNQRNTTQSRFECGTGKVVHDSSGQSSHTLDNELNWHTLALRPIMHHDPQTLGVCASAEPPKRTTRVRLLSGQLVRALGLVSGRRRGCEEARQRPQCGEARCPGARENVVTQQPRCIAVHCDKPLCRRWGCQRRPSGIRRA